jgi:hypothetical protein
MLGNPTGTKSKPVMGGVDPAKCNGKSTVRCTPCRLGYILDGHFYFSFLFGLRLELTAQFGPQPFNGVKLSRLCACRCEELVVCLTNTVRNLELFYKGGP